ncbi:response regulator [candidate division WOR-3 bacterium]|nr:response regulator [candidate division WOR-3 bacterium]MCK4576356.1 response regulator [candidate division WOR-3 bacterium]
MAKSKILVVDDNAYLVDILSFSLEMENYEVLKAYDGEEALKIIFDTPPDLILADIMMPKMDGFELCKKTKDNSKTKDIPFLFLTAKGKLDDQLKGFSLGGDDYIVKPFNLNDLLKKIAKSIEQYKEKGSEEAEIPQEGKIIEFPILKILQLIKLNKQTATITTTVSNDVGKIYIKDGKIVGAETSVSKDRSAIELIFSWKDGNFKIERSIPQNLSETEISLE